MTAVDTNVIVRLLTGDDARQTAAAKGIFAAGPVWISSTVLLDASWVLQHLYSFEVSAIRDAFTNLLGLKNVHMDDRPSMDVALALTSQGIELADAIHFCSRPAGAVFVSFDKSFVRRARRAGETEVALIQF